jgi:hypothetical protein
MKRTIAWSMALLLIMTLALSATATSAQTGTPTPVADLCGVPLRGAIGGLQITATPNYSGYSGYSGSNGPPYDYDGGPYYTPTPMPTATPLPQPENPVNKSCEFGKVLIAVTSDRHGTYRIGDVVVVDIYISTSPEVQLNFDNLTRDDALVFENSDFELVTAATVESTTTGNRNAHHIQLRVRSFSTKPILWVSADMLYATEVVNNAPGWKRLTTPPLQITTTPTLDHSQSPLEGDIKQRFSGGTWLANLLIISGGSLSVLALLLLSISAFRQWLARPRRVNAAEITWSHLDTVLNHGKQAGFTRKDYAHIARILRAWLDREPATLREIQIVNQGDDRLADIKSALSKLDKIIFAPQGKELTLNPGECSIYYSMSQACSKKREAAHRGRVSFHFSVNRYRCCVRRNTTQLLCLSTPFFADARRGARAEWTDSTKRGILCAWSLPFVRRARPFLLRD